MKGVCLGHEFYWFCSIFIFCGHGLDVFITDACHIEEGFRKGKGGVDDNVDGH